MTDVRRVSGLVADELFVLCRPAGIGDAARQAEAVYRALGDALAAEGLGIEALVAETVSAGGAGTTAKPPVRHDPACSGMPRIR